MRLERQRSDGRCDFWEAKVNRRKRTLELTSGIVNVRNTRTTKTFTSSKDLSAALDKLTKAKLAAGFKEPTVIGSHFLPKPLPTNPVLEAAIREDRSVAGAYGVYADWLQGQDSPVGEWIAVAASLEKAPDPKKETRLQALTDALSLPTKDFATWGTRSGFFEWLRLENSNDWMAKEFDPVAFAEKLFATPLCAALEELRIGILRWDYNSEDVPAVLRVAGKHDWAKSLLRLHLGDVSGDIDMAHHSIGDVGDAITTSFPNLRWLKLHSGSQEWRGEGETFGIGGLALPALETLVIETCAMTKGRLAGLLSAKLPKLTALELWFGSIDRDADATAEDLEKLLDGTAFPAITKLGIVNQEFGGALIERLASSKLAPQLVSLDLSKSTLDSTTAPLLAEIADRFPKLESLNVNDNFLVDDDIAALTAAFKRTRVLEGSQDKLENAEDNYRYASVSE
ncbi:MAG: hypothetical protein M4D80_11260 [Myxococcota bacterium]|nr:hypothetical protein [Deltaproteobacteria bacterium]MDQ3335736.1 hypothetical protein [Myxococcota bacterium]